MARRCAVADCWRWTRPRWPPWSNSSSARPRRKRSSELDYQDSDQVFTWENGRQVHPDVIRQRFNRAVAKAGLPPIRLHDVRHCYATAALASGISPKIVSERLGHASVAFTLGVYSHMIPGLDREAADQVAAMILGHGASAPRASS